MPLKLISPLFNVATSKFKITYVVCIIFLLDSIIVDGKNKQVNKLTR